MPPTRRYRDTCSARSSGAPDWSTFRLGWRCAASPAGRAATAIPLSCCRGSWPAPDRPNCCVRGCASMKETLPARLHHIRDRTDGRRVSLIGWSAGGIFARELARALPDDVRSVITLGSPFRGNHQATTAWRVWRLGNRGPDATQGGPQRALNRRAQPLSMPTTCIYSKSDGIVAWQCCTSLPAPQTENIEVRSSHLGYGHNLETLSVIADRLAQPENGWRPFRP